MNRELKYKLVRAALDVRNVKATEMRGDIRTLEWVRDMLDMKIDQAKGGENYMSRLEHARTQ